MSREELSLLLFLETCAVDRGGSVNVHHMNGEDMKIAKRWKESGFLSAFRRIPAKLVTSESQMFVKLSDDAFKAAHAERKARAERITPKTMERFGIEEGA